MKTDIRTYAHEVDIIKSAILQSQARAVKAVNQEQLALYFGIGRYVSINTRNKNWGKSAIKSISVLLQKELPGLRGFGERHLKYMRSFYEAWCTLEDNSAITIAEFAETPDNKPDTIRQLQLANLPDFPLVEFLGISFTHHIRILYNAKDMDERLFYIRYCHNFKPTTDALPSIIKKQDLYHHQGSMPNNFLATIPDYKQAYRAISMFKDEYLIDFINVEELGMHDEEIDERVIEQTIVHNIKNFIMTFGKGFAFIGNQVHYDKLGHDHWIDLLFYNRELRRTVVFELKKGKFKIAYLAQLSAYLRILGDDNRYEGEELPIGMILCKDADKAYVEYVMQDFRQPMGVATYKTAEELEPRLLEVLPPKEEMVKLLESCNENVDK